jgi:hypothetical protein
LAKLGQFRRRMRGKCHKFSRGFPSSVSGSFLARCQLPPKGKPWRLRRGSKKRTQAYGFSSGLCALTWRFSAGTSFGFGQPQDTARTDNIQTCSSRSPPYCGMYLQITTLRRKCQSFCGVIMFRPRIGGRLWAGQFAH